MKLFLKFGLAILWSIVLTFYIVGCLDVNNANVSPIDLRATVKFVNFAHFGSSMTVTVNKTFAATVNYDSLSTYLDLPAGTDSLFFRYSATTDTLVRALDPDKKCTIYSVFDSTNGDTARAYIVEYERQTYGGSVRFVPDSVLVRFLNLTRDTAYTGPTGIEFHVLTGPTADSVAHDTSRSAVTFAGATPYYQASISKFPRYMIISDRGDVLTPSTPIPSAEGRYAIVLSGSSSAGTLKIKVFKED